MSKNNSIMYAIQILKQQQQSLRNFYCIDDDIEKLEESINILKSQLEI